MLSSLALITLVSAVKTRPCTEFRRIVEFRELSTAQKQSYWDAVKCLRQSPSKFFPGTIQTRWEDLVDVHAQASPQIHNTAQFLPWHRYFLSVYYNILETECQYNGPGVYWDWTVDSQAPDRSTIWDDYGKRTRGCVYIPAVGYLNTNLPWKHCVARRWIQRSANEPALMGSYYSASAISFIVSNNKYDSFRQALESGPHNNVHEGIGGDMNDLTSSPNDPMFFAHHQNIDRLWAKWQKLHPSVAMTFEGKSNSWHKANKDDTMLFFGLTPDIKVSQALDPAGNGANNNLMCLEYSNSITPQQAGIIRKREVSIFNQTTPDSFDRTQLFNLRPPTPVSDASLKAWNYDDAYIAKIRSAENKVSKYLEFLNKKPLLFPSSLKNLEQGNTFGWVSKSNEQQEKEDLSSKALLEEYGISFEF